MTSLLTTLLLLQSSLDRAQALLREGKLEDAQRAITIALQEQPDSVAALTVQGRLAMAQDKFEVARLSFERAASLAPKSASVQFLLGFFYYVDNDFIRAQPVLGIARKLAPDPRTSLFLALTEEGLGQPNRAEPLFQETLRLEAAANRPTLEAHIAYARMLFSNGRFDDAQKQVSLALALKSDAREALYEQARLDFEAGRMAECISNAKRALKNESTAVTSRQIHFLLSRAYARAGDTAQSKHHRAQFEAIAPRLIR